MTTSTHLLSLPCYGGPMDGKDALASRDTRFFWFVATPRPHLVATTGTLEYDDIRLAEGCYARTSKTEGRRMTEILIYKPIPGVR